MGGAVFLRNIPADALELAHRLCEQNGLSLSDTLRQAIVSGLLVEATRYAPDQNGMLGGRETKELARALRRHLGSAIDLLVEQGQHPYQEARAHQGRNSDENRPMPTIIEESVPFQERTEPKTFSDALGDDLDFLGIGTSLTETEKAG